MNNKLSKEEFRELVLKNQIEYRKKKDFLYFAYNKTRKFNKNKIYKQWYNEKFGKTGFGKRKMNLHIKESLYNKNDKININYGGY